jgi:phosphoribosyl-AMP cyclohydrolase
MVAPRRRRIAMSAVNELEEGSALALDWEKLSKLGARGQRVVPVVLQHADSNEVLFVGYANDVALRETLARQQAVLWSTSRDELWHKGASSGDLLDLVEVRVNCEQNSLLYRVRPRTGGVCHTRGPDGQARGRCYYRRIVSGSQLEHV